MNSRTGRTGGQAGFTLIELLVVIIIIGILAAVAVPQYFKVVERGRLVEAQSFMGSLKSAQERYLARYGQYCDDTNITKLDIGLQSGCAKSASILSGNCGMKFFVFTSMVQTNPAAGPTYTLVLSRCNGPAPACGSVPPAYYGDYTITYVRKDDALTYGGGQAANCTNDF